jgi:predicted O-methyltransferase YrrM
MYKYSQSWFLGSEIKQQLLGLIDKSKHNKVLEIGCFEGLSSVFFADNLLGDPNSRLTCVDPFSTIDNNDHKKFLQNEEESRFDYNISVCNNADKIKVHKITSDQFFQDNIDTYTFIYIDGCHECDYIRRDMENAWKVLEVHGIMWMDDYAGGGSDAIKNTMNEFLIRHMGEYCIIHIGYQLAIRKSPEQATRR